MCNHYSSSGAWRDEMGEFSQLKLPLFDEERPKPNVQTHLYPGRTGEILRVEAEKLVAGAAHWRLIPKWWRQSSKDFGNKWRGCNNARSEGIASSRMFRDSLKNRCLIPADAIFEYASEPGPDGRKIEYEFRPAAGGPLWIAGLWEASEPSDGPLLTYAMVMTEAGPDALSIGHPRSPIFLERERMAEWLDPTSDIASFAVPPAGGTFRLAPAAKSS
jgi:putative SOS response-associated peptidase YedK